jgi:uncharacterized phage protein (TIGR02218 family)
VKDIDSGLLGTYQSDTPTIVPYVIVERTDGEVFRWVGHDKDLLIDGQAFTSQPGIQLSSLVSTEGFAVDNAEVTVLEDADITRADILAGVWNGAQMTIGQADWKATSPSGNILKRGTLGVFKPMRGHSVVEFRDLRQAIQGDHATVLQPTCRYKLGDSKCTVVLAESDGFTVSGTVDSSANQYSVADAARTEADDFFGEGVFTFTNGLNAGLSQKVKTFAAGVFVFWRQFIYPIGNDAYTVTAGCRLRFQEDCITKFDNGVNFGGEPNKLNPDTLTAPA